jgi:hypothetical protein
MPSPPPAANTSPSKRKRSPNGDIGTRTDSNVRLVNPRSQPGDGSSPEGSEQGSLPSCAVQQDPSAVPMYPRSDSDYEVTKLDIRLTNFINGMHSELQEQYRIMSEQHKRLARLEHSFEHVNKPMARALGGPPTVASNHVPQPEHPPDWGTLARSVPSSRCERTENLEGSSHAGTTTSAGDETTEFMREFEGKWTRMAKSVRAHSNSSTEFTQSMREAAVALWNLCKTISERVHDDQWPHHKVSQLPPMELVKRNGTPSFHWLPAASVATSELTTVAPSAAPSASAVQRP